MRRERRGGAYRTRGSAGATIGVVRLLPVCSRGGPGPGLTQARCTFQPEGPWDAHPSSQPPHSPGPQTVDLTPVFSSTGTRLMAPSMCGLNTSQSRSKRPKANLSDTWGGRRGRSPVTAAPQELSPANLPRVRPPPPTPQWGLTTPLPRAGPGPPTLRWIVMVLSLVTRPPRLLPPILLSQTRPSLALKPPVAPRDSLWPTKPYKSRPCPRPPLTHGHADLPSVL